MRIARVDDENISVNINHLAKNTQNSFIDTLEVKYFQDIFDCRHLFYRIRPMMSNKILCEISVL